MRRWLLVTGLGLGAVLSGCAAGEAGLPSADESAREGAPTGGGFGDAGGAGEPSCASALDCPTGFTCEQTRCVPPEAEVKDTSRPPVASPNYVFALNPSANSVARIDPRSLAIEAIPVGTSPVDLAALPGEDAAVVLSSVDSSVAVIDSSVSPSRVSRIALKRQYGRLAVSGDGAFAIVFPDPDKAPNTGAEGIVTVLDLKAARAGAALSKVVFERAAGYRVTDVVFRMEAGKATRAYLFAKATLSTFDLTNLAGSPLPSRIDLPASMAADINSREVISDRDGKNILVRSTTASELAYFDGATLRVVPLPEVATDIDILSDGSAAVAALRISRQVAYLEIPGDLITPAGIQLFPTGEAAVGQVELPTVTAGAAKVAFVYTNATDDESFARVDLSSGLVSRFVLEKLVESISLSPDGKSAVILHRPQPTSKSSDPYERAVDADEGYSVFDIATGYSQLKRTGKVRPGPYAFSAVGGYVGVALRDDANRRYSLDAVSLQSLVANTLSLASSPVFLGPVPVATGSSSHRIFVSQVHPAGRISVVDLATSQIRTATGFTLNAAIE